MDKYPPWMTIPRRSRGHGTLKENDKMNQILWRALANLHKEETGQDLIEYALVVALIAFAAIVGMGNLANGINDAFSKISSKLTSALP